MKKRTKEAQNSDLGQCFDYSHALSASMRLTRAHAFVLAS